MIRQKVSDQYERLLDKMGYRRAPERPKQIHLSVTDRCFFPVNTVTSGKMTRSICRLNLLNVDKLGAWCAPAGMNFVGGEPAQKDLEQLMARAVRHGFEVSFNTNGWLMTQSRADAIAKAGTSIAYVSLDGIEPTTIDYSRGREGSYEKAMAAIEMLRSTKDLRVIIAAIFHKDNATEIPRLLDWVEERNAVGD